MNTDLQYRLLDRCRRGDRKAQYELYKQFVKPLYHAVIRLVPVASDAEDIVQDAFISIFKNIGQYRSESSLYSWMRRIAVNKALDEIRKKKNHRSVEYSENEINEIADWFDTEEEETIKKIHEAIKRLSDGCREILSLYLFEDFKHAEIAAQLGISESTSKSQYARAKKLLAISLSKQRTNE